MHPSGSAPENMLGWCSQGEAVASPLPNVIRFPASINRRIVTPVNDSELFSRKLLQTIELYAAALENVTRLDLEAREACGICATNVADGKDSAAKSKRQRCGVKESSEICKALTSLRRAVKRATETVEGLRMTLIDDINCGATPPFILSESLRYGLDVPQMCIACGQAVNKDNEVKMPHASIAEMIFSWHHIR